MEKLLQWLQFAYIGGAALLVIVSVGIYFVSTKLTAVKETEWQSNIADANARAEEANNNASQANARAEEANARAEEAKLELVELIRPRTISSEARERMTELLKKFAGQKFAFMVYEDPESHDLAAVLSDVLRSAGWEAVESKMSVIVQPVADIMVGSTVKSGVFAFIGAENSNEVVVKAFSQALIEAGIPCQPSRG